MKYDSLSCLIRPSSLDAFLRDTWARALHFFPQGLGGNASEILSLREFELLLATLNRAHEGWLHFARGGLKPVPQDMLDKDGMLDLRKVSVAFANGETLYLTKAERLSRSLMHLCRAVELDLAAHGIGLRKSVNAHVFLTPPSSQGFPLHRDEHASIMLQLEGSKEWTVYEPSTGSKAVANEVLHPGRVDLSSLGEVKTHTHRLQPGDVLYMPEWWPHEARASSSHSLHVTLRVFPLRWVDLMMQLCDDHPALSGSVPRDALTKPKEMMDPLIDVLHSRAFCEPLPELLEDVARRHFVPETVLPDNEITRVLTVDQVELDTPLVRPAGTLCTIFESGDEVCIGFPGGVIRGPSVVREVFEHVANATIVRPSDLPPIDGLNYDRLEIARTMVRDGLLRIADDKS